MDDKFNKMIIDLESKLYDILDDFNKLKQEIAKTSKNNYLKTNDNSEGFRDYILNFKLLKERSCVCYFEGLEQIKVLLHDYINFDLPCEIIKIDDVEYMKKIIEKFENSAELVQLNLKRHHYYSAAYNNYLNFLEMKKNGI